ncbi:hypothetical protein [Alteromonas sp. 14N.309.X.WAT.G.H12]|uniref:hypothetical protein n=1 Tax=Alteromonas sp. 14N.309.X.WAT.G.H12 TaxID=3120824 RepID=UPI002FD34768
MHALPPNYRSIRWIIAEKVSEVLSKVSAWQKNAQRLGIAEPRLHFTGHEKIVHLTKERETGNDSTLIPVLKKEAVFSGCLPLIDSYNLLAKVQLGATCSNGFTNLVLSVNRDAEIRLASFRQNIHVCMPTCDHCPSKRQRKITFILENNSTGELLQIAENCLGSLLGREASKQVMAVFDMLSFFCLDEPWNEMDASYVYNYRYPRFVPVATLIEMATFYTTTVGFVRSRESGSTQSAMMAALALDRNEPSTALAILHDGLSKAPESFPHSEHTSKILAWVNALENPDGNSYVNNIKKICAHRFIDTKQNGAIGLLASIPSAFHRYQRKQEALRLKKKKINAPFGIIKARGALKLTLVKIQEKQYGVHAYTLYSFVDDAGRAFIWKASNPCPEIKKVGIGDTIKMVATIKEHSYFDANKTHYTYIKICKNITPVPRDFPVPDFNEGSKKRRFKESFLFTSSHLNYAGENIGVGFMLFERTWEEKEAIRTIKGALPLHCLDNFESALASCIMTSGVSRNPADPYSEKKDRKFLIAAREALHPYLALPSPQDNILYLVDSAFPPLFSSDPLAEGPAYGNVTDKVKGMPRFFFNEEEAVVHARRLSAGRILKMKIPEWKPAIAPTSMLLSTEDDVARFKAHAARDRNTLVMIDISGQVKRIEPLGMGPDWAYTGYEILRIGTAHAEPNPSIAAQSPLRLRNRKYATITGLEKDPELSKMLKAYISDKRNIKMFSSNGVIPDTFSITQMKGVAASRLQGTSLQFLVNDIPYEGTRGRLLVVTDSTTSYYLSLFGANVINTHLVTPNTVSQPLPGSRVLHWHSSNNVTRENITAFVKRIITGV